MKLLEEDLRVRPTITYEKRADLLYELLGIRVSKATICRRSEALAIPGKKINGCHTKGRRAQSSLEGAGSSGAGDSRRLVFVEKMGTSTSLCALLAFGYGYAHKLPAYNQRAGPMSLELVNDQEMERYYVPLLRGR